MQVEPYSYACMYCNENNLNKLIELLKNNSIDIHRDNENMFLLACKNGNLDIVKYLIINAEKYSGKKINIHIKGNCAFNKACMNNHVNIVKYLMTIAEDYSGKKIDINYNNDEAFAYAYIKNNIDIYIVKEKAVLISQAVFSFRRRGNGFLKPR